MPLQSRIFDWPMKFLRTILTVTLALLVLVSSSSFRMKLLSAAAHHDWMTCLAQAQSSLKVMQSENDLEAQRKAFSVLSDNLYKSIRAFGLGGREAYYDYCPMAFNNEGAF